VEELFFRGLAYTALDRRFGRGVALIGSSLVFGLLHFQPGALVPTLFLLANLTVFGLILGASRMYFGRTGPAVFSHMFFNLTAALAILAGVS
jgi:membrane protease YdiL (CAAX protease family)